MFDADRFMRENPDVAVRINEYMNDNFSSNKVRERHTEPLWLAGRDKKTLTRTIPEIVRSLQSKFPVAKSKHSLQFRCGPSSKDIIAELRVMGFTNSELSIKQTLSNLLGEGTLERLWSRGRWKNGVIVSTIASYSVENWRLK